MKRLRNTVKTQQPEEKTGLMGGLRKKKKMMKLKWIRLKAKLRVLREAILRSIDLQISKLFEITFFDSNQPTTFGRVRTKDTEILYDFIRYVMVKPEYRNSALEEETMMFFDLAPPCEDCTESEFEDKDECLLDGDCHQDTSFGFEWKQLNDTEENREYKLITGEDMYWDLTLLNKEELKVLKSNPEENWKKADVQCRSDNWHRLTKQLGMDKFFEKLGQEYQGDLDALLEGETTGFSPVKKN